MFPYRTQTNDVSHSQRKEKQSWSTAAEGPPQLCQAHGRHGDTHRFLDGEGAPQRHQRGPAVGTDETLVMEDAVALVRLKHPRTPERHVEGLSSQRWKHQERISHQRKKERKKQQKKETAASPNLLLWSDSGDCWRRFHPEETEERKGVSGTTLAEGLMGHRPARASPQTRQSELSRCLELHLLFSQNISAFKHKELER